jgi:hypothetical protein
MGVFVAQQAVRIVFVLSFAPWFFQLAGMSTANLLNFGIGISACGVIGNISAWFMVNRVGRRLLFIVVCAAAQSSSSSSDSLTSPAHRLGSGTG